MPDIMGKMDIAFPHLGIYLHDVPKSFSIGGFSIAMYGIVIAIAMLCGIFMAGHIARKTGQNPDIYWDVAIWLILFSVAGARIFYCIFFWNEGGYASNPLSIFNLRQGGLAIAGGIIGGVITLLVYTRVKKQNLLRMMDTAAFGLITGQIIGRWANFFNREVFGRWTDSLFAMRLPLEMVRARDIDSTIAAHLTDSTNYIQVHPTFLYESLWNIGVLLIMLSMVKRKRYQGKIALIYFAGYGLGRAWIELVRTDQLYLIGTTIPVNCVLGAAVAAVSIGIQIADAGRVRLGMLPVTDYSQVEEFRRNVQVAEPAKEETEAGEMAAPEPAKEETKAEETASSESVPENSSPQETVRK